jgi:hypothetical protein
VAVQQPNTRVIRLPCNHEVSSCWKHGDVTSWRVDRVECITIGVGARCTLSQDEEVVPVKMDRMGLIVLVYHVEEPTTIQLTRATADSMTK